MTDVLGVPIPVVVFGMAIVACVIGIAWIRRITRLGDDPDARAERYRDRFN
jgi:hypothetical protein